ncbi:Protein of unknown function [Desulfotomaculum arcticum]|uniref:DUF3006 domain-containing protein n=1 Tax=Desulfotruncus arcticus DSM 17038 TaxID=1121424 RepID=A0A1I2QQV1_9FIRM|nr:Protein of unknown function [Desulfotomaculum arcticum] [Desulfotruncus arcticus DSM 17038]
MMIIEHFEGNWAVVVYNNSTFNLPKELLPKGAREGDAINLLVTLNSETVTEYDEDIDLLSNKYFK